MISREQETSCCANTLHWQYFYVPSIPSVDVPKITGKQPCLRNPRLSFEPSLEADVRHSLQDIMWHSCSSNSPSPSVYHGSFCLVRSLSHDHLWLKVCHRCSPLSSENVTGVLLKRLVAGEVSQTSHSKRGGCIMAVGVNVPHSLLIRRSCGISALGAEEIRSLSCWVTRGPFPVVWALILVGFGR